jgi:integrase
MPKAKKRDGVFERKDRPGWWVSYVDAEGVRHKKKVKASTRTQALEALNRETVKVEREHALGVKEASDISTKDLLKRFRRHQKARVRPSTYERLGGIDEKPSGILKTLIDNLPTQAKLITRRSVAEFIEKRSETVSPGTVSKEVSTLKHSLRLAVEWGELHQNPAQGARLPKLPEGKTRYLTPGELQAALEIAPEWMRAPMALAVCTAMRRGSLLGLRWMDVDLPRRRIYLRTTKSGPMQVLPLSDSALQVLDSLPVGGSSDLVFPGLGGAALTVATRRVFAKLGILDASFHTLRHTAASWMVQQGVDLYAVGQFLGHKTPRMTQRYAHLCPRYMAEAADKLDLVMARVLPERPDSGRSLVPVESPEIRVNPPAAPKLLM